MNKVKVPRSVYAVYASLMFAVVIVAIAVSLSGPPSQAQVGGSVPCNAAAQYDASTSGSTVLVATPTNGRSIYICGYTFWAGGTTTVKLNRGTGTTCGTGTTAVTPAFALVTQSGVNDTSPFFRGLNVPPGQDLCITTNAAIAVQALVFYTVR